jgi:single-strand DNA-binding protein
VLKIRLACTERYKDTKANQWTERTEFVNVTVWGKRGEALGVILAKGSGVLVEGALRTSSYEKNGEKRYSTEVVASNVILAGGKRDGAPRVAPEASAPRSPRPEPTRDDFDYGGASRDEGDLGFLAGAIGDHVSPVALDSPAGAWWL